MVSNIFIIVLSTAMFLYWLRYTCLLLLQMRPARDYAKSVVESEGLRYAELDAAHPIADAHTLLQRDYLILTGLLERFRLDTIEMRILKMDYLVMKAGWKLFGRLAPRASAACLAEMVGVLRVFATAIGRNSQIQFSNPPSAGIHGR